MIILDIAGNELRRMFQTPLAWSILAVVQFLLALFFFLLLNRYLDPGSGVAARGLTNAVVAGTLQIAGVVLLLVTPFLTMRLFSEEQKAGTLQLLYAAPVSLTELVLGKFLGVFALLLIMLAMIALMPASLLLGTQLDGGQLGAAFLGLALLMAAFTAVGMFASTLTAQPAVAAVVAFAALFVLWIIHIAGHTGEGAAAAVFSYLSLLRHYDNLLQGLFDSVDVIYYLLLSATFIVLSIWRLDAMRTYH